jgi:hypothetical protein
MGTMLTAEEARGKARKDSVIHTEIRDVEIAIFSAIANGLLSATVTGTTMTYINPAVVASYNDAVKYFNVWQGLVTDKAYEDQMNQVLKHFLDLGYSITRQTNVSTATTFQWLIEW